MFLTGVFLWLVFGLMTESLSVTAANAVTFVCVLLLVATKWRYEGAPVKMGSDEEFGGRHWGCIGCGQCHIECPMEYGKQKGKRSIIMGNKNEPQIDRKSGSENR